MSIVRIGLAETKNFSNGYDAIFGKKSVEAKKSDGKAKSAKGKKKSGKKK